MEQLILGLIDYFKQFSYWGVILALSVEIIPAELVLPLVGYWVYQGDMIFWLALAAGSIGGVTGPLTLYALGRYGGRPLIKKYGKYLFISEKSLNSAERFFEKYGAGVAFFARFIPGIRTVISIPCGMAKMNVWKFMIYTYLAMFPITFFYVYIGFHFGAEWEHALPFLKQYLQPLMILCILCLAAYILFKYYRNKTIKK
ncbi:DedA family protein [Bacillus horti]|uniref:Membrane protein DedA with SNARE-associated domain n=1 Tax=Caldalkalibacillus horti TaxID=77523 RepID=A0ABT9VTC0_9BACI|nr:DedA family protein [Bacillus horti]MDQ0164241.1 membrane protein DedA with SNARE-associated domain [Bacillus horti]